MRASPRRAWLAPEVIQTSQMDCGPASLKCLLEGFGIRVSYGRLREACQTDVDGTSVDDIERVAGQLGLEAEQLMLPADHLRYHDAATLPALVVTRKRDGAAHFVVVWRRQGDWFQIMDPAVGRRWIPCAQFLDELYRYQQAVPAAAWREWAATDDFLVPLRRRCVLIGAKPAQIEGWVNAALAAESWQSLAELDGAVRMTLSLIQSRAFSKGRAASAFVEALLGEAGDQRRAGMTGIADRYQTVHPIPGDDGESEEAEVMLVGAVLIRIRGLAASAAGPAADSDVAAACLSPDLEAALKETPPRPEATLWQLLTADGLVPPFALLAAATIAVAAGTVEALLLRGLLDVSRDLNLTSQRLYAVGGLIGFLALVLGIEVFIAIASLRLGRHLELRLRMALLRKLPLLGDRYLQSRPISDMAERGHGVHMTRLVPELGVRFVRSLAELIFTLVAIAWVAPASVRIALMLAAGAVGVPLLAQGMMSETDLKVRTHSAALLGYFLDTLVGLVAVRTHGAETAIRRQHEARLTDWVRASRSLIATSLLIQAVQGGFCVGLSAWLLWDHLQREGTTGSILLLAFWTLKLPAIGKQISGLARQYPAERNSLLRLLEPLQAPEEAASEQGQEPATATPRHSGKAPEPGVGIRIQGGKVVAAGHTILRDIDLVVAPGEHVAIVGPSGAGKSSLLGLLLGWHRLAEGQLTIDDAAFDGQCLQALRRETAWVDPAIQVWNRTFLENLCYSAGDSAAIQAGYALEQAELRGVVQKLPNGMQTSLGENGGRLSGGEAQRVRLGRALLQSGVRLVLCDEPFRGLDHALRLELMQRMRQSWRDSTLLCVTHDVGDTLEFERVLVCDGGRIVEDGVPARLATTDSRFRQLLQTEKAVHRQGWEAEDWRRLRVEKGAIDETPRQGEHREPRRYRPVGLANG